jgi:hypothetical protein
MKKINPLMRQVKGQRKLDREKFFAQPGKKAADWSGGRKQVQKDKKKEASRRACRRGWLSFSPPLL